MIIQSVKPVWGQNMDDGWAGFQYVDDSFVSQGIAWFERWDRWPIGIPVSHIFCVTGPNSCIEALAKGVVTSTLQERFADPHTHVFFRKPRPYSASIGSRISSAMSLHLGEKYGFGTIIADALANTVGGRLLNKLTHGLPNRIVQNVLGSKNRPVCSVTYALALNSLPEFKDRGILGRSNTGGILSINPQQLFEDEELFEPWQA